MKYVEPKKYEEHLEKDRMRKREARERKKQENEEANKKAVNSNEAVNSNKTEPTTAFTTKQSLHRSVSKVEKLLPKSPRKKCEVIKGLAHKYKLRIQFSKRGRKANILTEDQTSHLTEFFERPDITYTNPGRKDNKYVGIINGKKTFLQKRYLLWTLRDLLEILNGEENGHQFSFRQMYKYIKTQKQLVLQKDIPDTSCLCEVCENTCLMAQSLKRFKPGHPTDPHKIMEQYCCDSTDTDCIYGKCEECETMKILGNWKNDESSESSDPESDEEHHQTNNTTNTIDYQCWIREDKHIKKATIQKNIDEFYIEWKLSVSTLKKHIHRKREQVRNIMLPVITLKT